jgi:MFS family permease
VTAALLALQARTFASLRKHRNYRLFFTGQVISLSGTWMQNIALAWLVVELTHSPVALGILAFCRFGPFTIFGLFAGALADRFDNRRLIMTTQAAAMCVSIALAVLALTGSATVWAAYLLAFLGGTTFVFDAPGRHALTFQLVGRDELPNAVALNASLFNASRTVGPAIAGIVIATAGVGVCFVINAFTFLAVLTALALMRKEELHAVQREETTPSILRSIADGIGYVRRTPRVRFLIAAVAVISLISLNFNVLLPVLASETLDVGPEGFGILSASFGLGALGGALLSAALSRASWKALVAGMGGFGVAQLALAPQETLALACVLLFVAGTCFTLWMSNTQSILQLTSPGHLRGRVLSLWLFAFAGSAPVGGLFAGWLTEIGGTGLSFTVGGVASLAVAAAMLARPWHTLAVPSTEWRSTPSAPNSSGPSPVRPSSLSPTEPERATTSR